MFKAAIFFFIIGLFAFVLGAYGFAGLSIEIGKTLLFVFLILSLVSFFIYYFSGRNPKNL
ncbi:MAG: DUF1328 domain-containing protein [Bdellovibrionales bacterium]|nr:DUF1328 domain-containing protein [Bdellovibrionales bacterium]